MKPSVRILGMLVWLGALVVVGLIVLSLAGSRIGEHKSSTYGEAYTRFLDSWGGEIGIVPPRFKLVRTVPVRQFNAAAKRYEIAQKSERTEIIPDAVTLHASLDYGEQYINWLTFNAFQATGSDTYTVRNGTGKSGKLVAEFGQPENANLVYDHRVIVPPTGRLLRPAKGTPLVLDVDFRPGRRLKVVEVYKTKGMDVFKYNLSAYQPVTVDHLHARIRVNTRDFELYRFGLPHTITATREGAVVESDMRDFSTAQDLGVEFASKQMYLDQVKALVDISPLPLVLFLLVVFIFSQVMSVRFNAFHYLFVAAINVFYFLFVAYLIRFFGVWTTFGISTLLMIIMFLVYCPKVFGWRFARIVGVYLLALTVVYSLIFLMPIFRGLMLIALLFAVFVSIMIAVSRSDISKWMVVSG
ncbi:MAG: hypothetical protein Q7T82_11210 [Armatimonadota bacterium]|nr:hypothetical protein [Armatimonadota bacterium]